MPDLFYVSYVALWLLLLVIFLLVFLLYRHFGLMAMETGEGVQRDGLAIGRLGPPIEGVREDGSHGRWLPEEHEATLLVFASPDCDPCLEMMPYAERLAQARPDNLEVVAVVAGAGQEAQMLKAKTDVTFECLAEDGRPIFDSYRVRMTPFAFVMGEDGRIRSKGLCNNPHNLQRLMLRAGLEDAARHVNKIDREPAVAAAHSNTSQGRHP